MSSVLKQAAQAGFTYASTKSLMSSMQEDLNDCKIKIKQASQKTKYPIN